MSEDIRALVDAMEKGSQARKTLLQILMRESDPNPAESNGPADKILATMKQNPNREGGWNTQTLADETGLTPGHVRVLLSTNPKLFKRVARGYYAPK